MKRKLRSVAIVLLPAFAGIGAGSSLAWAAGNSAEDSTANAPQTAPARTDRVTVGDGHGNQRSDLTYGEVLDETQRLAEADPAPAGSVHLYGLLPDGSIGVIGVCDNRRIDALDPSLRDSLGDSLSGLSAPAEVVQLCGPAPGVEWPRGNPDGN